MKQIKSIMKTAAPALLVIFILGGKPAKVKGQETEKLEKTTYTIKIVKDKDGKKVILDTTFTWTDAEGMEHKLLDLDLKECKKGGIIMKVNETDDGLAYVYCITESEGKGLAQAKALAKTICTEEDGTWTITTTEDGDLKMIVKTKKEGESLNDVYIIKSGSSKGKEKKKK